MIRSLCLIGLLSAQAHALTIIDGNVTRELAPPEITAMRQHTINTKTIWINDPVRHRFAGPRLSDLIRPVTKFVQVIGADGYGCTVTAEEITRYQPILATSRDGKALPAQYAPAWLIFPYPKTAQPDHPLHHKSVWQVVQIESTGRDTGCTPGHVLAPARSAEAGAEFF